MDAGPMIVIDRGSSVIVCAEALGAPPHGVGRPDGWRPLDLRPLDAERKPAQTRSA